ncbi:MAG: hypothetical protein K6D95_08970 [Treponema sp.]|nr:hypothetical protein [Treponema sp.]
MKKTSKVLIILSIFISFIFASCTDPVFWYISNDVTSEEATVNGVMRSIARYTIGSDEYLVTVNTDGVIYKKVCEETEAHGMWTTVDESQLPFELHYFDYTNVTHYGQQILKVVSDSNYLYLITVSYFNNLDEGTSCPENFYIWALQPADSDSDGQWDTLTESDYTEIFNSNDSIDKEGAIYQYDSEYYYTGFGAFSTNSPKSAHRQAFIRVGGGTYSDVDPVYYKLNGSSIESYTISDVEDSDSDAGEVNVESAVYYSGDVHFYATKAVTTNECIDGTNDATWVYYSSGSTLYGVDLSGVEETVSVDASYTITALAVCSDAILIGRGQNNSTSTSSTGGITKVQLNDSIPETSLGTFTTNAQTQLLTSYLLTLVFSTYPDKAELDNALYAGLYFIGSGSSTSVSYSNVGLWSYYSSRGNWNRE